MILIILAQVLLGTLFLIGCFLIGYYLIAPTVIWCACRAWSVVQGLYKVPYEVKVFILVVVWLCVGLVLFTTPWDYYY